MPHLLTEDRNGLIAEVELTAATGTAEREAALVMLERANVRKGATVAADKAHDTQDFVTALRKRSWRPHVAQNRLSPTAPMEPFRDRRKRSTPESA